jgi:hypothetical protein
MVTSLAAESANSWCRVPRLFSREQITANHERICCASRGTSEPPQFGQINWRFLAQSSQNVH